MNISKSGDRNRNNIKETSILIINKHRLNNDNRPAEYMDIEVAENQWRALFECETLKRGLRLHSGGHGLVMRSLGLRDEDRFPYKRGEKEIPQCNRAIKMPPDKRSGGNFFGGY